MYVLANAFSLSMIGTAGGSATLEIELLTPERARELLHRNSWRSIVGHADTAAVFGQVLDLPVVANRETYRMGDRDVLIVGQYVGPRLPEGATELPVGARIEWYRVSGL